MSIELLIARWLAVVWVVCGLSHLLHPARWAALLLPLRERDTGGLILAGMSLPVGLIVILGHNVWIWGLPVIVTLAGWMMTLKCVIYLLFPRAHVWVMSRSARMEQAFRIAGVVMIGLGAVTAYDSFCRR